MSALLLDEALLKYAVTFFQLLL